MDTKNKILKTKSSIIFFGLILINFFIISFIISADDKEDLKFSLFMSHGIGPKSLGRGNTGVAILDEESIGFYNPAGLIFVLKEKIWLGTSYSPAWFGYPTTKIEELYGGVNFHLRENIGIGGLFLFHQWARKGEVLRGEAKTLKMLMFSYRVISAFSLGISFKQVIHKYAGVSTDRISEKILLDCGGFCKIDEINFGINLQNIIILKDKLLFFKKENLLENYKVGISYNFSKFLISLDLNFLQHYKVLPCFGIEIPKDEFIIRLGVYKNWPYNMIDQETIFYTAGIDFIFKKINLSYACNLFFFDNLAMHFYDKLSFIHRLSLQIEI